MKIASFHEIYIKFMKFKDHEKSSKAHEILMNFLIFERNLCLWTKFRPKKRLRNQEEFMNFSCFGVPIWFAAFDSFWLFMPTERYKHWEQDRWTKLLQGKSLRSRTQRILQNKPGPLQRWSGASCAPLSISSLLQMAHAEVWHSS